MLKHLNLTIGLFHSSRRLSFFVAVLAILFSCSVVNQELDYMHQSVEEMHNKLDELNKEISVLQLFVSELQSSGYATYVSIVKKNGQDMLTVTFKDGKKVTIGSARQGIDGTTDGCLMSVREEDGVWYWTISGEWIILPDGERAIAVGRDGHVGITPLMRIVDGWWEVSLDEGETWQRIIESGGRDGYTVFTEVDTTHEEYILLTLWDGQVLQVPRFMPVTIDLDVPSDKCLIAGGETLSIPYSLSGVITEDVVLTAGSDGKYSVRIDRQTPEKGYFVITAPDEYEDGYVFVMADDKDGNSFLKVIEFEERSITWNSDEPVFDAPAIGGTLVIPFKSNFECAIAVREGSEEWLSNIGSAYASDKFYLYVDYNPEEKVRVGFVNVCPANNPDFVYATLTIIQAGRGSRIDKPSLDVDSDGGEFRITLYSADGISMQPLDDDAALWIERELTHNGGDEWLLDITVHKNRQFESRYAEFPLYNSAGTARVGTISIKQKAWSAERKNDFILTCRANVADDYTVYLPLRGEVDCLIDWGDGTTDRIARNLNGDDWAFHRYDDSGPKSYTVSVSGSVEALNSSNIPISYGIISIEQWGRLGLKSMEHAFVGCTRLTFLPPDKAGAFSNVTSFYGAFNECTKLRDISPDLFAYCGKVESFSSVFSGCTSLTRIPDRLFAGCSAAESMDAAFNNCSKLVSIPDGLFEGCTALRNVGWLFGYCSKLKQVPENLFNDCAELSSVESCFAWAGLESVPGELFANNPKISVFSSCFSGCPLTEILGNVFASNKEAQSFSQCFYSCKLKHIPAELFDNNRKVTNFYMTFYGNPTPQNDDGSIIVSETPYSIIDGKKVHLYERKDYMDYFSMPIEYHGCFTRQDGFIDTIPESWLP